MVARRGGSRDAVPRRENRNNVNPLRFQLQGPIDAIRKINQKSVHKKSPVVQEETTGQVFGRYVLKSVSSSSTYRLAQQRVDESIVDYFGKTCQAENYAFPALPKTA